MKSGQLKALICDDHPLIQEGLRRALLDTGLAATVGAASSAAEVMAAVRRERWDIALLDINLGGGRSGLDVLKDIKAAHPRMPVLMLSMYPEEQFAVRVFRAGANGYLNKNLTTKTLTVAIRQVLAEGHYVSPKVATQLVNAVQQSGTQPPHAALSDREEQVLRLIGAGRTVGEIAAQLDLSVKTVSTYRTIVLQKLALENNAQLMHYVQKHGLDG